jgi:hypothetical protein
MALPQEEHRILLESLHIRALQQTTYKRVLRTYTPAFIALSLPFAFQPSQGWVRTRRVDPPSGICFEGETYY